MVVIFVFASTIIWSAWSRLFELIMSEKYLLEAHIYAIIINEKNEVLWIKSNGGKQKLMFPGGTLEKNESVFDALKREVIEETGLKIKIVKPIFSDILHFKNPPQISIYYFCKMEENIIKLSYEHSEFVFLSPNLIDVNLVAHPSLVEIAKMAILG